MFSSLKKNNEEKICKVCGGANISCFAHTARCLNCNVLLNFPYVEPREIDLYKERYHQWNTIKLKKFLYLGILKAG